MRALCLISDQAKTLAESALRLTPQVSLVENHLFMELSQCTHLMSEDEVLKRLDAIAWRLGASFRMALGSSPGEALARVQLGLPEARLPEMSALPIEAIEYFLDPFQLELQSFDRKKKLQGSARLLRELGIVNLRGLLDLPSGQVVARFGEEVGLALKALQVEFETVWPKFSPLEELIEEMDCEGLVLGADVLDAFMRRLEVVIEKVMLRLRGRALRLEAFELRIQTSKEDRRIHIGFPIPQGTYQAIESILYDRLSVIFAKKPLVGEPKRFAIRVIRAAPARIAQKDFFSRREEEGEAWRSLLLRLTDQLGAGSVFTAIPVDRYLPEFAWKREMREEATWEEKETLPGKKTPLRPLRLFRKPVPLALSAQGKFMLKGKVLALKSQSPPEKLSGEWWGAQDSLSRTYFKLETEDGKKLWVFKESNRYFLQGLFD